MSTISISSDDSISDLPPYIETENNAKVVSKGDTDNNGCEDIPSTSKTAVKGRREKAINTEVASKKQKMAEERLAKKMDSEINKIYKPGECMKYMNVEFHPVLINSWFAADIQRELSAVGAKLSTRNDLYDHSIVMWSRTVPKTLETQDGEVQLTSGKDQCARALYVWTAQEAGEQVKKRNVTKHLADIKAILELPITLVVFGIKDYFKSPGRKTANSDRREMTEIEFEMAITDLLVTCECDTVVVNTPNELALFVVQMTKAIAEEPHKNAKRLCEEQADFYMKGDNKNCVAIDKDGNGVSQLWQQMVSHFHLSSLETSRALCAKYSTPKALFEAMQSPNAVNEIADIGVSRAAVPGSKSRRLGQEFAKKLHTLFTATDGDVIID